MDIHFVNTLQYGQGPSTVIYFVSKIYILKLNLLDLPSPCTNPDTCLLGNIITRAPHGSMRTYRQAAMSTLTGVSHVCPGGQHVVMAGGLLGS